MTCTKAQGSFALPDPLRGLAAPAKPALAAAMVPIGHSKSPPNYCPGAGPPKQPSETQPQVCDVGGNGSAYNNLKWLLSPGLYPHGISVTNDAKAYLMPGIYWIGGGGLSVSGGGSFTSVASLADATAGTWGGGVMIYNSKLPTIPGGPIDFNGSSAAMKIKPFETVAPDPNVIYNDIAIYQDRTVTSDVSLNGSASSSTVQGIIYVPGAKVTLNGNGGTLIVDQVIADTYLINGSTGTIKLLRGTGVDAHIIAAGLVE
jgi:hypothetical protein